MVVIGATKGRREPGIRSALAPQTLTLHAEFVPRVIVDFDPPQPDAPSFESDTSDFVYFLSYAYSSRFGASHELALVALSLRTEHKINLAPLLNFADRDAEDEDDLKLLDEAWQDPAPLVECCRRIIETIDAGEPRFVAMQAEYPELRRNIEELGAMAAWADERSARVRITYELEDLV